jgi:hypothetical protein
MSDLESAIAQLREAPGAENEWCAAAPRRIDDLCRRWGMQSLDRAVATGNLLFVRVTDPSCRLMQLVVGEEHAVADAAEGRLIVRRAPGAALIA